jgi:hypothetical protein
MEAIAWLTSAWADKKTFDIRIEAAMSKYFCTEAVWKMTDVAMQFRGGRGYETATSLAARGEPPFPVERAMRDCRVNRILEGSSEIMRLFLAREAMDPHLRNLGDILKKKMSFGKMCKLAGYYLGWYTKQVFKPLFARSYKELGPLAKYFHYCEKRSHQLARTLFYYMAVHRQGLEKKQLLLGRLMDIGTELFAIAATCSYAHMLKEKQAVGGSPEQLADLLCRQSARRIEEHFRAIANNDDDKINALAENVIDEKFTWLEEGIVKI